MPDILAICYSCRVKHHIPIDPVRGPGNAYHDWIVKHPVGHDIDFVLREESLLPPGLVAGLSPNANAKIEYAASADLTITLASLATSATLVAGRESTAVSNATNKYLDALLAGFITTGTSPTAGTIELWVYGGLNDTPDYPDVIDGTDSVETFTSVPIKRAGLGHVASITTDTTSNRTYPIRPASVAARFGGALPKNWGAFVTHSSGVNLNATAGNHKLSYTPIYATVV
jgi:hypothetical protein